MSQLPRNQNLSVAQRLAAWWHNRKFSHFNGDPTVSYRDRFRAQILAIAMSAESQAVLLPTFVDVDNDLVVSLGDELEAYQPQAHIRAIDCGLDADIALALSLLDVLNRLVRLDADQDPRFTPVWQECRENIISHARTHGWRIPAGAFANLGMLLPRHDPVAREFVC